eukprot:CAMPEP_0179340772 /NCGR_PEP_ID=MMETSP0797-20121207/69461_1 /TAXON_ID=47934 /ORGANISM="Dinophysis acuminata, Strain DAEP01" /LENGTH=35 /DNA_ID= /DNA_START= /DNA_END= /DNA_ORIENTATION=
MAWTQRIGRGVGTSSTMPLIGNTWLAPVTFGDTVE